MGCFLTKFKTFSLPIIRYEAIFRARHAFGGSMMAAPNNSLNTKRKHEDVEMDECMDDEIISR